MLKKGWRCLPLNEGRVSLGEAQVYLKLIGRAQDKSQFWADFTKGIFDVRSQEIFLQMLTNLLKVPNFWVLLFDVEERTFWANCPSYRSLALLLSPNKAAVK